MQSTKNTISIVLNLDRGVEILRTVYLDKNGEFYAELGDILFKSRKEARWFIEIVEKEIGEKLPIKINDIYKSN